MPALDELLSQIQSELQLGRRDDEGRLTAVHDALRSYELALEEARISKYCDDHSIKKPKFASPSPRKAAQELLNKVEDLPELELEVLAKRSIETLKKEKGGSHHSEDPKAESNDPKAKINEQFRLKFPELTSAAELGKLLIFGAFAGRTLKLPGPLAEAGEWIDTSGDGTRSVSSAVRRIRNGHVFAVIICDQAISHQHSEPVVNCARNQKLPIGYAGKAGVAALARALESIEDKLAGR